MEQRDALTRVSSGGTLTLPAKLRPIGRLDHGGLVVDRVGGGDIRIRSVRDVLAELRLDAKRVFAESGETVADFLRERREEAARKDCPP